MLLTVLRKWKLYQRIHELHEGGMGRYKIGEEPGVARITQDCVKGGVQGKGAAALVPASTLKRPERAAL